MMYKRIIAAFIITLLISKLLIHNLLNMLKTENSAPWTAENYRCKRIPSIGGIIYVPVLIAALLLVAPILPVFDSTGILFMFIMVCIGFIGLIDDTVGDKKTKGIVRHMQKIMEGTLTTGLLKAAAGILLSMIASQRISSNLFDFIINILVIALFTNTINLLDLRPGRAVKAFLAVSLLIICFNFTRLDKAVPLLMLHAASFVYINYDLKEVCMLGDTGANMLGITLGYYTALLMGNGAKLTVIAILACIHIIAEKSSLSKIISNNKLLSYLDNLGRS